MFFSGLSKPPSRSKMNVFIVLETSTFGVGTNAYCASDKHFSVGKKCVENKRSHFRHTHTHTASYPQVLSFENEEETINKLLLTHN